MEHNLIPYYVIVDLQHLLYLSELNNYVSLKEAKQFDTKDEAEEYIKIHLNKDFNNFAIYRVLTKIALERVEVRKSSCLTYMDGVR